MRKWSAPKSLILLASSLLEEHIDKGIRSKKIIDLESLSSMVEQQVKKMIGRKDKEVDVHMVYNVSERPRGITFT